MLTARRALLTFTALAAIASGGVLLGQMEAGNRGILPVDSSQTLEIGDIHVDVGGKTAAEARFAGWRVAQREGFKALWAKSRGLPASQAPNLSDSVLDGLVSSIVVEREAIGPTRYIADLGILFDRARAGELLGVPGQQRSSAPMLLVPVMISGGTATSLETRNPWQRAWASFRTAQSPIDYVRVSGMGVDPLLVNAAQTRRPGRGNWRNLLDYYGAANVLVAQVQLHRFYPGGPARATFVGSFGPDRRTLGSFTLNAKDSADLPRMMAEGVQRMDTLFQQALAAGIIRGDPSLIIQAPPPPPDEDEDEKKPAVGPTGPPSVIQLLLGTSDAVSLNSAMASVRGVAGVESVTERGIGASGNSTLFVTYRGDAEGLRSALAARGWSLENAGGLLRVTRRAAPSPQPQPVTVPPAPIGNSTQ